MYFLQYLLSTLDCTSFPDYLISNFCEEHPEISLFVRLICSFLSKPKCVIEHHCSSLHQLVKLSVIGIIMRIQSLLVNCVNFKSVFKERLQNYKNSRRHRMGVPQSKLEENPTASPEKKKDEEIAALPFKLGKPIINLKEHLEKKYPLEEFRVITHCNMVLNAIRRY